MEIKYVGPRSARTLTEAIVNMTFAPHKAMLQAAHLFRMIPVQQSMMLMACTGVVLPDCDQRLKFSIFKPMTSTGRRLIIIPMMMTSIMYSEIQTMKWMREMMKELATS